jgi:hypothetical protein
MSQSGQLTIPGLHFQFSSFLDVGAPLLFKEEKDRQKEPIEPISPHNVLASRF